MLTYYQIFYIVAIRENSDFRIAVLKGLQDQKLIGTKTFDQFEDLITKGLFFEYIWRYKEELLKGEEVSLNFSGGLTLPASINDKIIEKDNGYIMYDVKCFSRDL